MFFTQKWQLGKPLDFPSSLLFLQLMISGNRVVQVVAIPDLSGYATLSGTDEKEALLQAALLQRQATRLDGLHGGRIVKSMGDAVMFAFDGATSAQRVLCALHREFPSASEQLGIQALPVHMGQVTVAHDGDIYGQTVNIAARIQGSALPGQIVTSDILPMRCWVQTFTRLEHAGSKT